jgi:hypothetical protein
LVDEKGKNRRLEAALREAEDMAFRLRQELDMARARIAELQGQDTGSGSVVARHGSPASSDTIIQLPEDGEDHMGDRVAEWAEDAKY